MLRPRSGFKLGQISGSGSKYKVFGSTTLVWRVLELKTELVIVAEKDRVVPLELWSDNSVGSDFSRGRVALLTI